MKILVTGGAGFIGSNLCEALLERGHEVICLDNFLTGKIENIQEFLGNPKFRLIEGDIRNIDVCFEACKGVDVVLHQAAVGSVPRSIEDPLTTHQCNATGFVNLSFMVLEALSAGRYVFWTYPLEGVIQIRSYDELKEEVVRLKRLFLEGKLSLNSLGLSLKPKDITQKEFIKICTINWLDR